MAMATVPTWRLVAQIDAPGRLLEFCPATLLQRQADMIAAEFSCL